MDLIFGGFVNDFPAFAKYYTKPALKYQCPYDEATKSFFDERYTNIMEPNARSLFNLGRIQQENGVANAIERPVDWMNSTIRIKVNATKNAMKYKTNVYFFARPPTKLTCSGTTPSGMLELLSTNLDKVRDDSSN